jgi:hypothetical protein
MSEPVARIDDLDVIKSLKAAIWKFAETANVALTDAESEMNRALMWLENEQRAFWEGQLRKRAELVERAKEAVRMKKIFKDSAGRQQSAVDEEKALKIAIRRMEEAEQKIVSVKKFTQKLRKEMMMYKGHVQRFATSVQNELPLASAQLDSLLDKLQQYVGLAAPQEVRSAAPDSGGSTGASAVSGGMARGKESEPVPAPDEQQPAHDPPDGHKQV